MSADNYYTIKRDESGKYVPAHGFMSALEDGYRAEIYDHSPRFDTREEAVEYALNDWSEYGLIDEGGDDDEAHHD